MMKHQEHHNLKSPLWCLTTATTWYRPLPHQRCCQRFAGFTKAPGPRSVARQVFPEATSTANASESEAIVAEEIPAASADEEREEERVATPPASDQVILEENVIVPDPPVLE